MDKNGGVYSCGNDNEYGGHGHGENIEIKQLTKKGGYL